MALDLRETLGIAREFAIPTQNTPGYHNILHHAAAIDSKSVVEMILGHRHTLDSPDRYGSQPLYDLCLQPNVQAVKCLLMWKADVNARGRRYGTALQAAAHSGSREIVQLLLDGGADVNAQDGKYGNVLQAAAGHNSIIQILLARGALPSDETGPAKQAKK